jgi:phage tail sheath protein FI
MPEYLSPGVYVEEVEAGPKPIEGVSTSTCGAVGVTALGPTEGPPLLVTSFPEFQRNFGGLLPEPDATEVARWQDLDAGGAYWRFPLAVKGFFDNGGQRLYVKRVVSASAAAASAPLHRGLYLDLAKGAKQGANDLALDQLTAIANNSVLSVTRIDGSATQGPFTVQSYDPLARTIHVTPALTGDVVPGLWVVAVQGPAAIPPPGTAGAFFDAGASVTFQAFARGDWGNALRVRMRPMVAGVFSPQPNPGVTNNAAATTSLGQDAAGGTAVLDVLSVAGFAVNDQVLVGGVTYTLAAISAGPPAQLTLGANLPASGVPSGTQVRRKANAIDAANPTDVWLSNPFRFYEGALVELDNGADKQEVRVTSRVGARVKFDVPITIALHDTDSARLIEARCEVQYQPDPSQPAVVERIDNLRLKDDGSPSYLVKRIAAMSNFVTVSVDAAWAAAQPDLTTFPAVQSGGWAALAGGDDHAELLSPDDFVGADGGPGRRTGIQALEDIDDVSICLAPGIWAEEVHDALVTLCESMRDRFAILDPPPASLLKPGERISPERLKGPLDTSYAALYYPWLVGRDFLSKSDVLLPPSGHVAGIYARVDVDRGVHKAPANEVVRGISKFELDISKREQDILNPEGVDALRYFQGRGYRVWGARTLSSDVSWMYVNVRRLFIFLEKSIDRGTQWVVFEPNDDRLWARVRATIVQFLEARWRDGMLMGLTADEAFFVKCDRTTMSQDDLDNGRLICVIGVAPVKPAEFVIFRIQQKTLEAKG